jgi:molecular chaperone Hsp33
MGLKDRYQGTSQVITGEIDEDVEHYLRVSEQIDSALGCDVVLADGEASVTAAAGMLVQALPESAGAALIRESQHALRTGALWRALASGERDAAGLVRAVVGAGEADELELLERRPARFACQCSATRVNEMLALLDHGDLESMIAQGQPAEVTCNFCKNKYSVSIDEMRAISSMQVPRAKA